MQGAAPGPSLYHIEAVCAILGRTGRAFFTRAVFVPNWRARRPA